MRPEKMTTREKWDRWKKDNLPWTDKTDLAKATPEDIDVAPMDWYMEGMPSYWPQRGLFILGGIYLIFMWFLNEACINETIVMSLDLLTKMNMVAMLAGGGAGLSGIYVLVDSHRGTFGHFEKQLQPWMQYDKNGKLLAIGVLRIVESWDVWPWEGDDEIERGIVLGKVDGVVDQPENIGLEPGACSNHADLHPVLMQIGEVASDEAAQQAKQVVDLLFRTCPVLRRKAEQSEMSDAKLDASLDRAPDGLDALAMTFGARQPTLCGPAAIAVHDDRDMAN